MPFQWTTFLKDKKLNNASMVAQKTLIKLSSKNQLPLSFNNKILQLKSPKQEDLSVKAQYLTVKNFRQFSKSSILISNMIRKVQMKSILNVCFRTTCLQKQ